MNNLIKMLGDINKQQVKDLNKSYNNNLKAASKGLSIQELNEFFSSPKTKK